MRHAPKNVLLNQGWHRFPKQTHSQLFSITHPCQVVLADLSQADWNNLQLAFIAEPPFLLLAFHFVLIKPIPNLCSDAMNTTPAG